MNMNLFTHKSKRASKGSVSIKVSNGRLQLYFSYQGQRHYLSLGLDDTEPARRIAEMRARQIELDIASGNFDTTLAKYKGEAAKPKGSDLTPLTLYQKYFEFKKSSWKPTTTAYHTTTFIPLLKKLGDMPVEDAVAVKQKLEKITTIHQTKRVMMQLNAACKWAISQKMLEDNPYEAIVDMMPKFRYETNPKPDAFTLEERERVIEAFRNHKGNWNGRSFIGHSYSYYAPLVEFWFLTGCRPSEAIGLQWKNVAQDFSYVDFTGSVTNTNTSKPIRVQGSKNNKCRRFPTSDRLANLLRSIKPENAQPDDLVFPSPNGGFINYGNFARRAWQTVVDPIKPNTTPYSCRDTFITLQIINNIPEMVIAQWCDTSVEMIQRHYADFKRNPIKPVA
ncbi:Arm DNA-binding domain-containing protein [Thermosynechococcus sp. FA-CM-4201]